MAVTQASHEFRFTLEPIRPLTSAKDEIVTGGLDFVKPTSGHGTRPTTVVHSDGKDSLPAASTVLTAYLRFPRGGSVS